MRTAVEPPGLRLHVRPWPTEKESLGEVVTVRELDRWHPRALAELRRLAADHRGCRVEPGQQPPIEVVPGEPLEMNTARLQSAFEAAADVVELLDRRQTRGVLVTSRPASIDDHAHMPLPTSPVGVRHGSIVEEPLRIAHRFKVLRPSSLRTRCVYS